MDSPQSTPQQPPVKKILVKRVKVLVKRPVSASPAPAAAPAPAAVSKQPVLVKVPVKRVVRVQTAAPAQTPTPAPQPPAPPPPPARPASVSAAPVERTTPPRPVSASGRPSYVGQTIKGVKVKPVVFELPDDILAAVQKYKKIQQKAMALYVYARIYAEQVAKERGRKFPPMLIEMPEDTMQMTEIIHDIDGDELFDAILDDLITFSPFIDGLERIVRTKAPMEDIIKSELRRLQDCDTTTADQIILAYLHLMIDMIMVRKKMELLDTNEEIEKTIGTIKDLDAEEKDIKERMVTAVKRKHFPVDAKKLVNNYFSLAKRDPDKAYETLITNPLFFSPIILERMPKKFFGLIKPSAKDAMIVNKQMASFFKSLKV